MPDKTAPVEATPAPVELVVPAEALREFPARVFAVLNDHSSGTITNAQAAERLRTIADSIAAL